MNGGIYEMVTAEKVKQLFSGHGVTFTKETFSGILLDE